MRHLGITVVSASSTSMSLETSLQKSEIDALAGNLKALVGCWTSVKDIVSCDFSCAVHSGPDGKSIGTASLV